MKPLFMCVKHISITYSVVRFSAPLLKNFGHTADLICCGGYYTSYILYPHALYYLVKTSQVCGK